MCCPSGVVCRVLAPLVAAMKDKSTRARTLFHDVPEKDIVEVLSAYGIEKEMLPTEMGGTVGFSQEEWVANRRAVEMEEI